MNHATVDLGSSGARAAHAWNALSGGDFELFSVQRRVRTIDAGEHTALDAESIRCSRPAIDEALGILEIVEYAGYWESERLRSSGARVSRRTSTQPPDTGNTRRKTGRTARASRERARYSA